MSKSIIHSIQEVSKILNMPYPTKLSIKHLLNLIKTTTTHYTIDDITKIIGEIKIILKNIKEGDLVDIQGYRGEGLYYYNGQNLIKTYGEYGYIIPSVAWKFVDKYGLDHYDHYEPEYVAIPISCSITATSFNMGIKEKMVINNGNYICTLKTLDYPTDTITIDGKIYKSTLFDNS